MSLEIRNDFQLLETRLNLLKKQCDDFVFENELIAFRLSATGNKFFESPSTTLEEEADAFLFSEIATTAQALITALESVFIEKFARVPG